MLSLRRFKRYFQGMIMIVILIAAVLILNLEAQSESGITPSLKSTLPSIKTPKLKITPVAEAAPVAEAIPVAAPSSNYGGPVSSGGKWKVDVRGTVGHHLSFFIPTRYSSSSCSIVSGYLPPGVRLSECKFEGIPQAPGTWALKMNIESYIMRYTFLIKE